MSGAKPQAFAKPLVGDEATIGGSGSIVPFIVLCTGRTGSTLLLESLAQHPRVAAYNEPLNAHYASRDPVYFGRAKDNDDGAGFVRRVFDPAHAGGARAIGFKMMYDHAASGPFATAWTQLVQTKDLVVFDLVRQNLLEVLVSVRIAEYTGAWRSTIRSLRTVPSQIYLSPHDCTAFFELYAKERQMALGRFARQRVVTLTYEQLRDDLSGCLAEVCAVLGVEPFTPKEVMEKQERRSMRERIENYEELKFYFRRTPHERYFA